MSDVTIMLERINAGNDPHAAEQLLDAVYKELHIIAQAKMSGEKPGHTLQATILVHDAWLRLFPDGKNTNIKNRAHFFGAAAKTMRRVLVDHARQRAAIKRGKKEEVSETKFAEFAHPAPDEVTLALDEALKRFAEMDKETVELIELRFFVGMTIKVAAETLGMKERSAERACSFFMAWFRSEYRKDLKFPKGQANTAANP